MVAAFAALALVVAADCGGSSSSKKTISTAAAAQRQASLLGDSASAGDAAAYEPTGDVVADSGFRPWVDGFGFENYGNDVGPQNMTPAEVEDIFGSQVCASGTGADCELIPTAAKWMEVENERMAGGHCMGFPVTANQFYAQVRDPSGAVLTEYFEKDSGAFALATEGSKTGNDAPVHPGRDPLEAEGRRHLVDREPAHPAGPARGRALPQARRAERERPGVHGDRRRRQDHVVQAGPQARQRLSRLSLPCRWPYDWGDEGRDHDRQ